MRQRAFAKNLARGVEVLELFEKRGNASMDSDVVYELDGEDCLFFVNAEWLRFALAHHAAYLADPTILGRSVWDFVVDRETRLIYEMLFDSVRQHGEPVHFNYRCDTPVERRNMRMEMLPHPQAHIYVISSVVRAESRPNTALLDPTVARSEDFLTICSWCKKVLVPDDRWVKVEEAVETLNLFDSPVLPQLTHGICPACRQSFSGWRKPKPAVTAGS